MNLITKTTIKNRLKRAIKKTGSQRQWALDNNLTPQNVNHVMRGRRDPGVIMTKKLGGGEYIPMYWMEGEKKPTLKEHAELLEREARDPWLGVKYDNI